MNLTLKRLRAGDDGTFGEILMDSERLCVTCELPWYNNKHDISCVPTGTYHFIPHDSHDHPGTWEAVDVPNRKEILIHNGNTIRDTKGCILVGSQFGKLTYENLTLPAVLNSGKTLEMLRSTFPDHFTMTII